MAVECGPADARFEPGLFPTVQIYTEQFDYYFIRWSQINFFQEF